VLILPSLFNIYNEIQHPRFLVNSANEYLVGAQLPYFPRGGLPRVNNVIGGPGSWQFTSNWGGMSAGDNMVYPVQSLDGEVHNDGGELRDWLQKNISVVENINEDEEDNKHGTRLRRLYLTRHEIRCQTGSAVWSPLLGNDFRRNVFNGGVCHTVSPYNTDTDRDQKMYECYKNCWTVASGKVSQNHQELSVVTALIGTGVKCVPLSDSAQFLWQSLRDQSDISDKQINVSLILQTRNELDEILQKFAN